MRSCHMYTAPTEHITLPLSFPKGEPLNANNTQDGKYTKASTENLQSKDQRLHTVHIL